MNPVALFEPRNLLTLFVAVGAFATILALFRPALGGNKMEGRLKSLANRREELRKRSRQAIAANHNGSALRQSDESFARKIVERFQLSRLLADPKVAEKMAQAGYRGAKPINRFYFFRLVLPFVFAVLAGLWLIT